MLNVSIVRDRKTFRLAVRHTDPHVIVFMGDLMDEGSVAKPDEFQRYVARFKDVFYVPSDEITVSLPITHNFLFILCSSQSLKT